MWWTQKARHTHKTQLLRCLKYLITVLTYLPTKLYIILFIYKSIFENTTIDDVMTKTYIYIRLCTMQYVFLKNINYLIIIYYFY